MNAHTPQPLHFEGGRALSQFRTQALLTRLQAQCARIAGVTARHVHWVALDGPAQPAALDRLTGLLTYGETARRHR